MEILAVKLSSLGDILHVLPAVHALKAQTGAEIDWAVHPEFASLVRCFRDVRRAIEIPRHRVMHSILPAIRDLRRVRYDLVVDLQGLAKSGVVSCLARGDRRIAPSYAREGSGLFFRERAGRLDRTRHAVEQAFDTLAYLGLKPPAAPLGPADFILPPPPPLAAPPDVPLIAIAPVSRWTTKNWPTENFAAFARIVGEARPDARFAVVGGKADAGAGAEIAAALPGRIENLCGKTSIAETMALLARCDLLAAVDTGPVHMAAAVGTRCLVVFGATRPEWTGPWGEGHRVVAAGLPCQPCVKRRCRRGDLACLAAVSPGTVAAAALEMLAGTSGARTISA